MVGKKNVFGNVMRELEEKKVSKCYSKDLTPSYLRSQSNSLEGRGNGKGEKSIQI